MSKAAKKPKNAVENDKLRKVVEPLQVISDHFAVLGEESPSVHHAEEEASSGVFAQYDKDRSGKIDKADEGDAQGPRARATATRTRSTSRRGERRPRRPGKIDAEEFLLFYARVYAPAFKHGARLRAVGPRARMAHRASTLATRRARAARASALHHAAQARHVDLMKMLAERRDLLNVDAKDNSGWTPLMCAASNGPCALRCLL